MQRCGECQGFVRVDENGVEWVGYYDNDGHWEPDSIHQCPPQRRQTPES